jgi:glycosyltransferase involved in cell wall biosynthesis
MKVRIFTNYVAGGWCPTDLNDFLGGSEEAIVLFSEALQRAGYDVTVYHEQRKEKDVKICTNNNDVQYFSRESVAVEDGDILISFKDSSPWRAGEQRPAVKIHWTAEIENLWDTSGIDAFVPISEYHAARCTFVPFYKNFPVPLGVDIEQLDSNKVDMVSNTILYSASPDRGLYQLLIDWQEIKERHPQMELRITYGFENFKHMVQHGAKRYINQIMELTNQTDVKFLGKLTRDEIAEEYWRAAFWCLPLQLPDSELFCLNAVKASYCNCVPIINRIGALQNTVGSYIPYSKFVKGSTDIVDVSARYTAKSWDRIVSDYWMPLFERFLILEGA